ncbi:hypothetical protein AB7M17_007105 [Bradyrhizobium sp. USDA 377]
MQARFKQAALFSVKLLLSIAVLIYHYRRSDLHRAGLSRSLACLRFPVL